MKESETIKEYSDKLLSIDNKLRLLGSDLHDSRIVEKILVTVPEKFEATIATLENTKDLSKITLAELLNALQAQEQRRVMRQGGAVEGALKCNQLGHEDVICKGKAQQQKVEAQVVDQDVEDQLFVATCFASNSSSESWLIDSGCTNHMTYDKELFKELESTTITKVRIGNGDHIAIKGKGTIAIESCLGTKTISDVLYVQEIIKTC
ncbi:hypothetical protein F0562_018221 [Nyssa sinensis]|uniref:Retrovirus-related Pol polyprotein from transposon TNT 1-94-like beta-barrel domain-containing protein n=1 Tax=Nyssa sinensis TaxID=561372 RepID=A0A5J4ZB56_9ASTE|nr:hypothetical protein F0562_018221 [Nyssa sinensis]